MGTAFAANSSAYRKDAPLQLELMARNDYMGWAHCRARPDVPNRLRCAPPPAYAHSVTQLTVSRTTIAWGSLFATLWALANVIDLINLTGGRMPPVDWLNLAAAAWLLARPSSAPRLALLAATEIADTLVHLPYAPDHQMLAAFVNIAVLVSFATRRPSKTSQLMSATAPYARVIVLVAYFAAASAKYNTDFLTPAQSCASRLAQLATLGMVDRHGLPAALAVALTIGSETSVFFLLLIRRTRRWGVLVGCTFHFLVSASPSVAVADFTTTLWSLFLLFLAPGDLDQVAGRMRSGLLRVRMARDLARLPSVAVLVIVPVTAAFGLMDSRLLRVAIWLTADVTGALLIYAIAATLRRSSAEAASLGPLRKGQVVALVGMLTFVATPYLGLGTSSRFTMFSNLRTEGPGTNHLFWPSVHVVDTQNHWMIVEQTYGAKKRTGGNTTAAEADAALPVFELRRALANEEIGARLRTPDGHEIVIRPGDDSPLRGGDRWWEAKTQLYRPFSVHGVTEPGFCSN